MNKIAQPLEKKAFYLLLFVLLLAGVYVLSPFLKSIILAVSFAILFAPLHKRYLKWFKQKPNLAAVLSVLSVFLMLLIPIGAIFTLLTTQLAGLIKSLTSNIQDQSLTGMLAHIGQKLSMSSHLDSLFGFKIDVLPIITKGMEKLSVVLSQYTLHFLENTLTLMLNVFIMIITMFYLFREGPHFFKVLVRLTPVRDTYEHSLANEMKYTVNGVFYGSFLTAIIQAVLATLGFYFLNVDGYLVWGSLTFFMSFIPLVGTGATLVPIILLFMIQGDWKKALFLSLYGFVVIGLVDNVLKPYLIKSNVHPLILFLSIFGGLAVFGPFGLLFGPMLFALITSVLRIYDKDFQPKSGAKK